jgi:hypothetical protein
MRGEKRDQLLHRFEAAKLRQIITTTVCLRQSPLGGMAEHEIQSGALLLPHPSPMRLPLPCRSRSLSQAANS